MKVLLTGHQGYLGTVMAPVLRAAGHDVTGLDVGWFERVRSTYRKSLDAFVEALEHSAPVPAPLSDGLRAQVIAAVPAHGPAGRHSRRPVTPAGPGTSTTTPIEGDHP